MRVEGTKLPHFPPKSEVIVHGTEKISDFRCGITKSQTKGFRKRFSVQHFLFDSEDEYNDGAYLKHKNRNHMCINTHFCVILTQKCENCTNLFDKKPL